MAKLDDIDIEYIKFMVHDFIRDLKELDTYNVTLCNDCDGDSVYSYLSSERVVDGQWVNNYSLTCLVDNFAERIKSEFENKKLTKEEIDKMF